MVANISGYKANVKAQYPGKCAACGQPIKVGDMITPDAVRGWDHQSCPPRVRTVGNPDTARKSTLGMHGGEVINRHLDVWQEAALDAMGPEMYYEDGERMDGYTSAEARRWVLRNCDALAKDTWNERGASVLPVSEEATTLACTGVLAFGKGFPAMVSIDGVTLVRGAGRFDSDGDLMSYTYYSRNGAAVLEVFND